MDADTLFAALRTGQDIVPDPELSSPRLWLTRNATGNTPLHVAARHGRLNLVPEELFTPEYFSRKNQAGYTPLHRAFEHSSAPSSLPPRLLLHDLLAITSNAGFSCYHIAAANGHLGILSHSILTPELLSIRTHLGNTLLHEAAEAGRIDDVPPVFLNAAAFALANLTGET
ncbi:MAG: ankyrin repeat domain-containing protein, partial [Opitutaceae bacterium]|nr:ankyrin repeat domain-containing protein [Opitutaceae bacterium]